MRFPAHENFPSAAVEALRDRGYDVAWVREDSPGITDEEVLFRAQTDNRILLTFDKDFGELAFRSGFSASCGIILFRISPQSPSCVARVAMAAITSRSDCERNFSRCWKSPEFG